MKKILVVLFILCAGFLYSQNNNTPCSDTIIVPNAFTPTLSTNKEFFPSYLNTYTGYKMVIYNRWGNVVYSGQKWDGTFNGKLQETGVFVYEIVAYNNDCEKRFVGSVTLIKF